MERPARPVRADLPRRVAVVGGSRIPFARSDGPYATASNQDMLTAALDGLAARYDLQGPGVVGEFVAGAVLKHSRDFNLARETLLGSALDPRTPAYDIQQACGTGLQAVISAANKIALGQLDSAAAAWRRHRERRAARRQRLPAPHPPRRAARPFPARAPQGPEPGAPPAPRTGHPAQRRAAHRAVHG